MRLSIALLYIVCACASTNDNDAWIKKHGKAKPFKSKDLKGVKAKVQFLYHGPVDAKGRPAPVPFEGRIMARTPKQTIVGLTIWKDQVAFHAYNKSTKTLEVYLMPEHLQDKAKIRIAILPVMEFNTGPKIKLVRVIHLP